MGYDRAITIFSPDGRLLQVEYAFRAVNNGPISMGLRCKDGVVLIGDRVMISKLQVTTDSSKVFKIDDFIGGTFSGLAGDGRTLMKRAIIEAQRHRLTYDEPIDIRSLSEKLGDLMQLYTQFGGTRPFGVALIIGGIDKIDKRVFLVDPSGTFTEYKAIAIGMFNETVVEILEKEYKEDMSVEEGVRFGIDVIRRAFEKNKENFDIRRLEVGVIKEKEGFRKLSQEEVEKIWGG